MPPKKKYTHRMSFVYEIEISESLMDIISYLEKKSPGTKASTSDAIRYSIRSTAEEIRKRADRDVETF